MTTLIRTLIFFSSFFLALNLHAQHLKIRNYSFGYRVFEIASVGNNPVTIVPLLKDPSAYQNYLNTISYNSLYGAPGIQILQNYYLDIEMYKDTESMFWKKHSLQTGLLITNKLVKSGLAIANQELIYTGTDTTLYINQYSLTQNQKFLGANFGLNKRLKISNKFQFLTGLHLQGSFAFIHNYNQQLDSSTYTTRNGPQTRTTLLSKIKGKNFFQWQVMIPLGLEFDLHKKQFFIRLEADAGIIGSRYRPKSFSYKEAHGAGLWLIYLLK